MLRKHSKVVDDIEIIYLARYKKYLMLSVLVESNASVHRTYTAIAKLDCKLVFLDQKEFLFAVQETPMFAVEVMKSYSERLSRLQHMV